MGITLEKPVKDFIARFQKDLGVLQGQIRKEGDDLVKKVKMAATKQNVDAKRRELERLVEAQMRRLEPKFNRFVKDINENAKKAGIDLTEIEKTLTTNFKSARDKLAARTKKKTNKKSKKSKSGAAGTKKTTRKKAKPAGEQA